MTSSTPITTARHVHQWGDPVYPGDPLLVEKACSVCGIVKITHTDTGERTYRRALIVVADT